MDINQLTISGRIAKINDSKNENSLTFALGNNKTWKDKNGDYQETSRFYFCQISGKKRIERFLKNYSVGSAIVLFSELDQYKTEAGENYIIRVNNFK